MSNLTLYQQVESSDAALIVGVILDTGDQWIYLLMEHDFKDPPFTIRTEIDWSLK
jgi:hypothetical protein